ncbi:ABC transporter G family member 23-like isoform X2 [Daktulosphaira vitifoliae]|nr:ABC transporter G family member 23-like isoform X2 [Daktulosphaira vitifoliae]
MGFLTLDYGTINVQVNSLLDIGYMPQSFSLDRYLTANETLIYFGMLYNMDEKMIENKTLELSNLLELDFLDSYIKDLSGGQCRRISLAISLLHDPKLIILDEPTVGLDIILSTNIWNRFVELSKFNGKTIIITTHYIEEASQADKIGFMKDGKLLNECSPRDLLEKYDTDLLEAAFIKLCQESNSQTEIESNTFQYSKTTNNLVENNNSHISRHRIKALVKKNWFILFRDFIFLFITFILPIFQTYIMNITSGTPFEYVDMILLNNEVNMARCTEMQFNECIYEDNINETMSCGIINYLRSKKYNFVYTNDEHEGIEAVNKGRAVAFINFYPNFTNELQLYAKRSDNYSQELSAAVYLEKGNFLIKQQVYNDIYKGMELFLERSMTKCSYSKNLKLLPMNVARLFGDRVQNMKHEAIARLISLFMFVFSSMYSTGFMLSVKLDGTLVRSLVAGVTMQEVMISLLIVTAIASALQILTMMFICYVCFYNPFAISASLFLIFIVFIVVSSTGFLYGLLSAGLSNNNTEATFLCIGYILSQLNIGGIIWPLESQNWIFRIFSENQITTLGGRLMNNILIKSLPVTHPLLLIDFVKSFGVLFFHIIGVYLIKYVKKDAWDVRNN